MSDTSAQNILYGRKDLKPDLGFKEVFVEKSKNILVDISELGDTSSLEFIVPKIGIIQKGELKEEGWRLYAGSTVGNTQLLIYRKENGILAEEKSLLKVYNITVTTEDLLKPLEELYNLIGDIEGLELRIMGDTIVVDGKVLVPRDMNRASAVLSKYPKVLNLVEISPLTNELIAKKMEEEIAGGKDRQKSVRVKVVNGRFFLEGRVDRNYDRGIAEKICESYVPDKYRMPASPGAQAPALSECMNLIQIRQPQPGLPDPMLSVRVDIVSISRQYVNNFNFRWNPGVSADGSYEYKTDTGKFIGNFVATIINLFPKLSRAKNHNHARILKTMNMLMRDGTGFDSAVGQPAKVSENINIPYTIPAQGDTPARSENQTVTTELSVSAKSVAGSDKINLAIAVSTGEVTGAANSEGRVPTTNNSLSSYLVISSNESAALGGLITERRTVGNDRGGSEGENFTLFDVGSTKSFNDQKNQIVIFVSPRKLRSATEGSDVLKRKFRLRR